MLRGLFVTGTDTGVGKTVVAAALMHRYRSRASLRYWKPIQTGTEQDNDTAEVRRLACCTSSEILDQGVRLPNPVSPHLAARLAGQSIELEGVVELVARCPSTDRWIVEGAGGVLVPINRSDMMADLIGLLRLPVLVVARSTLGTINHTLLTLESLRARSLSVAGVVMVGDSNRDNRSAIEDYGQVAVVGEMPMFDGLSLAALTQWATRDLDPDARLWEWLR